MKLYSLRLIIIALQKEDQKDFEKGIYFLSWNTEAAILPFCIYSTQTVFSQSQTMEVAADDLIAPIGGMDLGRLDVAKKNGIF